MTRELGIASIPISVFYRKQPASSQALLRILFAKDDATLEKAGRYSAGSTIYFKPFLADPEWNRGLFSDLLDEVPNKSSLVILPEMFSTGLYEFAQPRGTMNDRTVGWMLRRQMQ